MSLQILGKTGKALYVNPALSPRSGKTPSHYAGQGAAVGRDKIVSEPLMTKYHLYDVKLGRYNE